MGMRKFGSAAPPFGKVACVVKGDKYFTKYSKVDSIQTVTTLNN
jgi:hypothetical protein